MWLWNPSITFLYLTIGIPLCLIVFTLRHQHNQVQDQVQQPNQRNQLNIARYKEAVSTAIWLQVTLVACYLPYDVVTALWTSGAGRSSSVSSA